ncbi:unnamed protein product [Orchesella dallaii]|uniref:Fe2OG dioxygenase domain-containing protein n=1 Tax=Orchesella dallaii TaxID=48710 RepID=A0ABP1QAV5_9HEXA
MGHSQPSSEISVPIINLSGIQDLKTSKSSSALVQKLIKNIGNACIQWGFFYVTEHGIDPKLINDVLKVSNEFFKQPKIYKKTVQRQPNNYRGYTDSELTKQKVDWKEAYDFGAEYPAEVNTLENGIDLDAGTNQWPSDIPHFKETLLQYFSEMHSLSSVLMDLIFMSLNVDPRTMKHHFNEATDTSFCRLNYYPVCADANRNLGVGPHADAGVLTVLLQDNNVTSLQVQKDGNFHDVPPIPGTFVINIGDMMQVWSNGIFQAPVHRVLANSESERLSVPFFFNPSYETNVEPLNQSVSNEHPRRYRSINWGIFRRGRILGDYADHGEEIQIYQFEIRNDNDTEMTPNVDQN